VEISGDVQVRLQLPEIGQHLGVRPLIVTQLGPVVVVLGHAAKKYLVVDGAGAAKDFAPGHGGGSAALGVSGALERPVVGSVGLGRPLVVVVLDVVGHQGHVGVIGSGV